MCVILMMGKGGVGKILVVVLIGLCCVELGYKILVFSIDLVYFLVDSFDMEMSYEFWKVRENFWGVELDVLMELEGNWGVVKCYII